MWKTLLNRYNKEVSIMANEIEIKQEENKEEQLKLLKETMLPTSLPIDASKKRVQKKDEAFEENFLDKYRTL